MRVTDLEKFSLEHIWRPYQTLCGYPETRLHAPPLSLSETAAKLQRGGKWADLVIGRITSIGVTFPDYIDHPLADFFRSIRKGEA